MLKNIFKYRLILSTKFLACLGILMTLWQLIGFFKPIKELTKSNTCQMTIGIIIILCCIFWAWGSLFVKKKRLELEINKRTKFYVHIGNVLEASGMRVIPVNEYFDTQNGCGIINRKSLHGKFISIFEGRIKELRQKIDEQLANLQPLPSNRNRAVGLPQNRYSLGTCIRINDGSQSYMLVAITRFNEHEHVDVSTEEFPEVIRKMYDGIEQLCDGNAVYLPLIGSGISGYQLTNMQILDTLARMAHNTDKLAVTNGIHVCIYNEEQMKTLNLNLIKYLYNRWRTLE